MQKCTSLRTLNKVANPQLALLVQDYCQVNQEKTSSQNGSYIEFGIGFHVEADASLRTPGYSYPSSLGLLHARKYFFFGVLVSGCTTSKNKHHSKETPRTETTDTTEANNRTIYCSRGKHVPPARPFEDRKRIY